MIKFEHTEVFNFEGAIRGMRNPMNSWDKSDSGNGCLEMDCDKCRYNIPGSIHCENEVGRLTEYIIGDNDLDLMKRLIRAGSDHRKFMRQILVSVDITAPLYWWKEFDTYKVATVSNSCSTMHKIHDKAFNLDDFSYEHLSDDALMTLCGLCGVLNSCREQYLETKDKGHWWDMIQLLPSSYNQRRTLTLNYEVLCNIYGSRRNHKLDEWSIGFMEWIESLPYAKELITDRS